MDSFSASLSEEGEIDNPVLNSIPNLSVRCWLNGFARYQVKASYMPSVKVHDTGKGENCKKQFISTFMNLHLRKKKKM